MAELGLDWKQRRLSSLRRAVVACWVFATFAVLGTVAWAGMRIRSTVNSLLLPGPARQQLMSGLESRVGRPIGSKLKADAGRVFRDLQPILKQGAADVDAQAPAAARAAIDALKTFRDDVPAALVKPLDDRLTAVLKSRRSQIAAHAAGKSDEAIDAESNKVFAAIHAEFIRGVDPVAQPYQLEVTQILDSIFKIRDQEVPNVRGIQPTWDMALMVIEEMHREVSALRAPTEGRTK